ncbi:MULTISPECIES: non-ribosomal peptide synthetase [unclassified Bacillus (in: firmicutes)]|uniref:non-ribosomal peptide synthetase n=1 Tax=unclassified Bacillus (in: firmicutes) TaxID=185979 RepID=UPI000BF60A3B|nr:MULTISPECIES: non-ribosomal peptide synthetase [unclassified Bacillus (in: firmicutes)]PEU19242.1 non-ribosomal peptide synthetase [Bacillus sp. AFS014408]PFW62156.1 non-ribosomal peptide synthetase [Bacillus sp. AFS075034]
MKGLEEIIPQLEEKFNSHSKIKASAIITTENVSKAPSLHIDDLFQKTRSKSASFIPNKVHTEEEEVENIEIHNKPKAIVVGDPIKINPEDPKTLAEVLKRASIISPKRGITVINRDNTREFFTYSALLNDAECILTGIRKWGLEPGDPVIFQFANNKNFISAFWACILGGYLPSPVGVAPMYSENNAAVNKLHNIWKLLDKPLILTDKHLLSSLEELRKEWKTDSLKVDSIESLLNHQPSKDWYESKQDNLVLNLFTSGSTGIPKCVQHCHESILSRARATIQFNGFTIDEVLLNWMPLDHVGGLVMYHIPGVYLACEQVISTIDSFIENPLNWLNWIDEYRATITWAPNFAYAMVNDCKDQMTEHSWDLSSMRHILNGGEAVIAKTAKKFLNLLKQYGLRDNAMFPSYGMSETSSGIVFSKTLSGSTDTSGVHILDKYSLTESIKFIEVGNRDSITFTEMGGPIPGVSIRIVDQSNQLLTEDKIGRVQVKGPNIMAGYYKNEEANEEVFVGEDWFNTGDLGFINNGHLTLTGREKNVIIINGNNYYDYEIETVIEDVPGVEVTFAAACAISDEDRESDSLAIFFSPVDYHFENFIQVIQDIRQNVIRKMGINPRYVVPVTKEDFPKTNSGKLQRGELSKRLYNGEYDDLLKKIDVSLENENTLPDWMYKENWKEEEIKYKDSINSHVTKKIYFAESIEWINRMGFEWKENDVVVGKGDEFVQVNRNYYLINPTSYEDYRKLFEDLVDCQDEGCNLVYLWSYSSNQNPLENLEQLKQGQKEGSFSLLLLAKTLVLNQKLRVKLTVITSELQAVEDEESLQYEQATLVGILKTLQNELPSIVCKVIDLHTKEPQLHPEQINIEMITDDSERIVVYRNGKRFVHRIKKMNIQENRKQEVPFLHGGLYIITGGLGGIGKTISKYLLKTYHAKLLLVGRSSLEDRKAELQELKELSSQGGFVHYEQMNLSNEQEVKEVISEFESKHQASLNGIIHLAGVLQRNLLEDTSIEEMESIFEAKVYGTYVLGRIAQSYPNLLFVNSSSAGTLSADIMLGAYTAANQFVESYTYYLRSKGVNSYCFAWGMWAGLGMNEGQSMMREVLIQRGYYPIDQQRGLYSLLLGLMYTDPLIYIGLDGSKEEIQSLTEEPVEKHLTFYVFYKTSEVENHSVKGIQQFGTEIFNSFFTGEKHTAKFIRKEEWPLLENGEVDRESFYQEVDRMTYAHEYVGASTEIEHSLTESWMKLLNNSLVGIRDNFFMLGGDSLKATQLLSIIRNQYGIEITLQHLFADPTISGLSRYIEDNQKCKENHFIIKREYGTEVPMSFAQQRQWVQFEMDSNNAYYNNIVTFRLRGHLNDEALEQSFRKIIDRHEVLRTRFDVIEDDPMQIINGAHSFSLSKIDVTHLNGDSKEEEVTRIRKGEGNKPFNLRKDLLIRASLIQMEEDEHLLIVTFHHIIFDGWSVGVFAHELAEFYNNFKEEKRNELPDLPIQYSDYALWQKEWLQGETLSSQLAYWKQKLTGSSPLEVSGDYSRPPVQRYIGRTVNKMLSDEMTSKLRDISEKAGTTLFMTLFAAYSALLQRYSGQNDFVIGSVIANRNRSEVEGLIGFFANTLPLRVNITPDKTFKELLEQVKLTTLEAYNYQDTPFEMILDHMGVERDLSRHPLFQVLFVLQNAPMNVAPMDGLDVTMKIESNDTAKFDLTMQVFEEGKQLRIALEYNTDLFDKTKINRLLENFCTLLENVMHQPQVPLSRLRMLSKEEQKLLLSDWKGTDTIYPSKQTIHGLFEEQAAGYPQKIAVTCASEQVTYEELNEKANRLARTLRLRGVKADTIVGIMVDRSVEVIISMLAVLKAGGAYMPIDPDYPTDRREFMLEDSKSLVLITQSDFVDQLEFQGEILFVDQADVYHQDGSNLSHVNESSDMSYVIYTSGTTGKPKGVVIEHRNVIRLLYNNHFQFDFHEDDVWTMFHSSSFDFSVWEMYGALLYGSRLVVVPKLVAKDPSSYLELLKSEKVTVLNQTPTAFYGLINAELEDPNKHLTIRYVIFGGEALTPLQLKRWREKYPQTRLINMYGITETTVHVTFKEITEREINLNINEIGRPIPTLKVYVMDQQRNLLPIGVPGEMYVGGAGLARGYLNRPELTAERFIENPFEPGEKLYKSGDLAKWLPNGNLEYLGRIDHQVKIRGHRIEIGEIEAIMLKCSEIRETVVVDKIDEQGQKYLCAYFISEIELTLSDLRAHLSRYLPDYMIPSQYVRLDKMPMTQNGKVDWKALPDPQGNLQIGVKYESPSTEIEKKMAAVWHSVLKIETIGVNDNFFDLGGDSIKTIRLLSAMNRELGIEMQILEIYQYPTIRSLALHLEGTNPAHTERELRLESELELEQLKTKILLDGKYRDKVPADIEDIYPMSDIEQGMVYYSLKYPDEALYHDQFLYELKDNSFDLALLQEALSKLIMKHPILRTYFNIEDFGQALQFVKTKQDSKIESYDIKHLDIVNQKKYIEDKLLNDRKHPFEFNGQCLWRMKVFLLSEEKTCLSWIFHHSILDGWSVASFMTELINTYFKLKEGGFVVEPLKSSYRDFIVEQSMTKKKEEVIQYWKEELSEYKRFQLPDFEREEKGIEKRNNVITQEINHSLLSELKEVAQHHNTTLKIICLSAYLQVLNMISYESDITMGLVENNRPVKEDGDKVLGCFLNTVPFRINIKKGMYWSDLITEVNHKHTKLKTYGRLSLLDIVNAIEEDIKEGNPIFDVIFNYVDFHIYDEVDNKEIGKNILSFDGYEKTNTKLDFSVSTTFDKLIVHINSVLPMEWLERLAQYYTRTLQAFVSGTSRQINKADILPTEEKDQLLVGLNITSKEFAEGKTIDKFFEEQVIKTPDQIALTFEDSQLTYNELNQKANQLAWLLQKKGVRKGTIVGILAERSLEMVIGIIATIKAGGTYVPLHPGTPSKRLEFMLKDSEISVLLKQRHLEGINFEGLTIHLDDEDLNSQSMRNLEIVNQTRDLAYILYTSGTTGKPKGVMVEHEGITNTIQWRKEEYKLEDEDKVLPLISFAFDPFITSLFTPLVSGACVYLLGEENTKNPIAIKRTIEKYKITHIVSATSLYAAVLDNLTVEDTESLRMITVGGEKLPPTLVRKTKSLCSEMDLMNEYGPTENSVVTTAKRITNLEDHVNIGKPIANTKVYILSENGQLQPMGVTGELCISGLGLARGYLNNKILNDQKFLPNPFENGERMYRSGDLARWLPNGEIEYLGRMDEQVKIRGNRVELEEISQRILEIDDIKESIVVAEKDENNQDVLCAYIISEKTLSISVLREQLEKNLPEYMIPNYFMMLEEFPLTANGKIDRKQLPKPKSTIETGREYVAPRNAIEEELVQLWCDVLDVQRVGIQDHFFELGGHSLKATMLATRIHKAFNVEFPLSGIFKMPTVESMAEYVVNSDKKQYINIKPAKPMDNYPVTSQQKRVYILSQMDSTRLSYNMPIGIQIEGKLNVDKLKESFNQLVQRHETLRTSFYMCEGELVQCVHENVNIPFQELDGTIGELERIIDAFIRPFELESAPLIRVGIVKLGEEQFMLLLDIHHIISDGISTSVLWKELMALYGGTNLPELQIQYKDYSVWQQQRISDEILASQEQYWLDTLNGDLPVLEMLTDYPRPAVQQFLGDRIYFTIDTEKTKRLKEISVNHETTMFMTLLAAYNVLLAKYSGQDDIIVGSPIGARPHKDLDSVIGMFVNTLALRNHPVSEQSFSQFLDGVRENVLMAYNHQDYPLEQLIEKLEVKHNLSRSPLFDTMFTLQDVDILSSKHEELSISPYNIHRNVSKFDLTLAARESNQKLIFELEYSTSLYKKETIKRLADHFIHLIEQICEEPMKNIGDLELATAKEKQQLLIEWNRTESDYPKDEPLHVLFEKQVALYPERVALVFGSTEWTYHELNEKANQLSWGLREKGIKPGRIAAVLIDRSAEMIISILAILKAGGAYLPIDPNYPVERINFMLSDSGTNLLVTRPSFISDLIIFEGEIVDVGDVFSYKDKNENLPLNNKSSDVACVIYTSGSTGKPKGNLTQHFNISRVVLNTNYLQISPEDRVLQLSNYAFDGSTFDIYGALLNGATLVMINQEILLNLNELTSLIEKQRISIFFVTTALFNALVDFKVESLSSVRSILFGGEKVSIIHVKKAFDLLKNTQLIHVYGPTETTVFATASLINEVQIETDIIPIGRPISQTKAYVLNEQNQIQPIGVSGELCLSGDGLARAYLNQPKLTAEKFVKNPFVRGERMYRTGDLVRWLPNGQIDYIGRMDGQVKIRGFRIEPGEISNQLLEYSSIREAVVMDYKDEQGHTYLCAFIVSDQEWTVAELRAHLAQTLPDYMIPTYFIKLDKLPLTTNGKVDLKALPEPSEMVMGTEYVAPRNEIEEALVQLWQEILSVTQVGVKDNFFEMGGHSLRATMLVSRMHKEFNVEFPLREVFQHPTIEEMSQRITGAEKHKYTAIQSVEKRDFYPVSFAQKRMYITNQLDETGTSYNMPSILELKGKLDISKVETAYQTLIDRHEALRTSFEMVEGELVQRVHAKIKLPFEYVEVAEERIKEKVASFIRPFNLAQAPLIRVSVLKITEDHHILCYDMHHIISDGITMNTLMKEFAHLYRGNLELPTLSIQYKDYTVWQQEWAQSEDFARQGQYWLEQFEGELPVLALPTDNGRSVVKEFIGDHYEFTLSEQLTKRLKKLTDERGATIYMTLLATYNILLNRYTGQEDIIVGSPVAGRPHSDLESVVGMFVNTLALRNMPRGDQTFENFLENVKENVLKAQENADYPLEELIENLGLQRDLSRNPLFDTMFVFQNMDIAEWDLPELNVRPFIFDNHISKFDLTLIAKETERSIHFIFEYSARLFKRETIKRIATHFEQLIIDILNQPDKHLFELEMLSHQEKQSLLENGEGTISTYPIDTTIQVLFEKQVERNPHQIALDFDGQQMTYHQLNQRANKLALILRDKGVRPNKIVGVLAERSLEMVVGLLAVLKAGGAYLAIDPEYPEERIKYMLEDSQTRLLLTQSYLVNNVSTALNTGLIESIDLQSDHVYKGSGENLDLVNTSSDLAYVIYTSGSTGKPKGVMVEHQGIENLKVYFENQLGITQQDRIIQFASFSFDASVWELFMALLSGATSYLVPKEVINNYSLFEQYMNHNSITVATLPPTYVQQLNPTRITTLRKLITAGSATNYELIHKWHPHVEYINAYGPTETTVCATTWTYREMEQSYRSVPIGGPILNTQALILDPYLRIQPIGVVGELCIAGAGLARGYLNRPEQTEERFISHPWIKGERLYRTGDLARWSEDGTIEYVGRIDEQVKIRGFRIEPEEIANHLLEHPSIRETVVIDHMNEQGQAYLCAYVVANQIWTVTELRAHLGRTLPDHMIPAFFVELDHIPLTLNGKVNRKALPIPSGVSLSTEYVAPRNKKETILAKIWKEVLELEEVGIKDNFFELGGDSIKSIQIVARLNLHQLNFEIKDLFLQPTIEELVPHLKELVEEESGQSIVVGGTELIGNDDISLEELEDISLLLKDL